MFLRLARSRIPAANKVLLLWLYLLLMILLSGTLVECYTVCVVFKFFFMYFVYDFVISKWIIHYTVTSHQGRDSETAVQQRMCHAVATTDKKLLCMRGIASPLKQKFPEKTTRRFSLRKISCNRERLSKIDLPTGLRINRMAHATRHAKKISRFQE